MSKNQNIQAKLSVYTESTHSSLIHDWVLETFSISPIETENPKTSVVQIDVYFETLIQAELGLKIIPDSLPITHAEATEVLSQSWETFWQYHFKQEEIGSRLRIIPYWEEAPNDSRVNIIINPGLSFGTGSHFTTRFCLEQLEIALENKKPLSFLDAGTGSGILSIAANKLGINDIHAFDIDATSTKQAEENAKLNGIEMSFQTADLLDHQYKLSASHLVFANILTGVLLQAAPKLIEATQKRLVLSGIREIEADAIADTFVQYGMHETSRDGDGEWCGIVLDKPNA